MIFLYFLLLFVALAFCIFMMIVSIKATKKRKTLQKSADLNFKNKNGDYEFYYIVKGFNTDSGKIIKIAIEPILGFSDLKTANTNRAVDANAFCEIGGTKIENCENTTRMNGNLNVISSITVPSLYLDSNGKADCKITVSSTWNLGGEKIAETFSFNYNY